MVTECLILKMEALYACKTVVTIYQTTWRNIPEDLNLHIPSGFQQKPICTPSSCHCDPEDSDSRFVQCYHTSLQSRKTCIVDLRLFENQVNMIYW
jgi:hypothetical protein